MDNDLIKKNKLGDELENAIKQIIMALKELQTTVKETSYYFIAFQLLSNGFERLLKCGICYGYLHRYGKFPNLKEIKTHNITSLLKTFLSDFFVSKVSATQDDYNFLTNDNDLQLLVESLSVFGNHARYHNLNVVTGDSNAVDIKETWQEIETAYVMANPKIEKMLLDEPDFQTLKSLIIRHFIIIFEKLTRAIVRQFTLGDLGDEPQRCIGFYSHFLYLMDKDIGTTDYYVKFFHKEQKVPPNYTPNKNQRQTINKQDFKGLWPFKNTGSVVVEKSIDDSIFLIINRKVYALNGLTASKHNLPFAHDLGETYQGRSLDYFINIASCL